MNKTKVDKSLTNLVKNKGGSKHKQNEEESELRTWISKTVKEYFL